MARPLPAQRLGLSTLSSRVPIVLLTTPANAAAGRLDYEGGRIAACLCKPFPPERLIVLAERLIAAHSRQGGSRVAFQPGRGERRVLTLLCSVISGVAGRTEPLEPASWLPLLDAHVERARPLVQAANGVMDSIFGDTLLAVFGLVGDPDPRASASAAARVALRLLHAMTRDPAQAGESACVRLGLHTAEVVVDAPRRSAQRRDCLVVGSQVQLAAHLPRTLSASGVVVSASAVPFLAGQFAVSSLGSVPNPDGDVPMATYHLCGPSRANE